MSRKRCIVCGRFLPDKPKGAWIGHIGRRIVLICKDCKREGEIEEAIRVYIHTWGRADLMLFIEEALKEFE